ncbi:PREDICTED: hemicentin-2-like [Acropora digitifera]|uniref:hemicentin-2-like n=1 Tax=Acropora digitifera TaxID=70779 RepID=UPI00077AED69|nr:PREDICTED: hemicentin-2-like [Acropora digitifera]
MKVSGTSSGGSVLIGKAIGTGNISVDSDYQGRVSGQVTNTKAELTIVGMQRSELLTCRFVLTPTISGTLSHDVQIIVQYTATTAFTTKPPNPTIVQEGKSFTLKWTYTLDGTVVIAQFFNTTGGGSVLIGKAIGTGNVSLDSNYQGRFSGLVTNTKAELTIVGMQRSELLTCRLVVVPTISGTLTNDVEITIHYSSSITGLSGETAIIEGSNVTLECSAVGNPEPNITWARLPDNFDVAMPLTNISRHDAGMFRCTANNGVGSPATGDVLLDVQYAPQRVYLNTNLTTSHNVCEGMMASFLCTVEASNPAVHTFTLLKNGTVISNKRDSGVWIRTLTTSGDVTYKCMATNSVGVTSSNYITFTVEASASVTTISNSIAVKEGQSVTLVCHGFGLPAPRISWSDAWNVVMQKGKIWKLHKINRNMTGQYSCMASNGCGNDSKTVDIDVQYPVEATCSGGNDFVAEGVVKTFTCPVDGNPEPNIEWYSEKTGRKISTGKQIKTEENGCYTCVARNYLGSSVSITQCLIVEYERSTTNIPSTTAWGEQEIRAVLTINANYKQAFEDVNSATSKAFVEDFVGEMDKVYKNIPEYIRTEVTQLRPGSVIVYFVLYFNTALTPEKGLENLKIVISTNGTFGRYKARDLLSLSDRSTTSTTPTGINDVRILAIHPLFIIPG